ncbi:MAG: nitroreductase [Actinobacteria bacterium]|nr:nitroreductase [Actinomycetota bacterium]
MSSSIKPGELSEFLASRRSTRDFLPDLIPREVIDQLIRDGLTSPSWSNTRPFVVCVAVGDKRDRISTEFLKRWDAVKDVRGGSKWKLFKLLFTRYGLPTSNWLVIKPYPSDLLPRSQKVGKQLYEFVGINRKDKRARDDAWARNYEFFGAPVELFIFTHKNLGKFAASDAGLFMQNLILSAHARGLGTCAQGAVATWEDVVRSEFNVPRQYKLLCGLALGHPAKSKINSFQAERLRVNQISIDE